MDELLDRHDKELLELKEISKSMLKGAKKSERAVVEAKVLQMEYDLKAKHREELDELEEHLGEAVVNSSVVMRSSSQPNSTSKEEEEKNKIAAKKAKNQRKKEKKSEKEIQRIEQKNTIQATAGPSLRHNELNQINIQLKTSISCQVKEILSDGNCLYRAIADQITTRSIPITMMNNNSNNMTNTITNVTTHITNSSTMNNDDIPTSSTATNVTANNGTTTANNNNTLLNTIILDYIQLRQIASYHIRSHNEEYLPFLGYESNTCTEFLEYCNKVEDPIKAEWGGQLEIKAISDALQIPIYIYDAEAPILKMGQDYLNKTRIDQESFTNDTRGNTSDEFNPYIIYLTYHRHYYALGAHYNSVSRIISS